MKFLLNMNLPRVLGRGLAAAGHRCRHVGDIGLGQARDVEILAEAGRNGETILTHDLDYGHLLAFSGETAPSVIIFRLRNSQPDRLLRRLMTAWPEMEPSLKEGAIVVLEDAVLRVRRLPITMEA